MVVNTLDQIEKFAVFFDTFYKEILHKMAASGMKSFVVDFRQLAEHDPELSEELLNNPEDSIRASELALESFDFIGSDIRVRFKNLSESQNILIRNVRHKHLNKFVTFEGIVRQSSDVRPQVTTARFECPSCGNTITMIQLEAKFREPSKCSCGRKGRFRLLSKSLVDVQRIIVEESPESLEGGEQPKRLSVFLREDLVEPIMEKKTTPGSKIKVSGMIKELAIQLPGGGQSVRYDLMAEANYIEPVDESYVDFDVSKEDEKAIIELSKNPKIYEKLTESIAPSIYGHEDIKEALVLQLMGGVKKVREDGTKTRGDMHILLVGDPGSGKSETLQFVAKIAPKGRLVSGTGVTKAGLTATVVKDEFLRGWALEAGALVLSNGGYCIVDELDKVGIEDTAAMHQALEQQIITISKANIQATLKAETTVLAAANPKHGRFDPYIPIAEQIDMPPTLINRFDLIFPVKDLPSKDMDVKVASHILALQKEPKSLKYEIPLDLLKKYIAYVKQNIKPVLTNSAISEIRNFYVDLRNQPTKGDQAIRPIPISARQLEALVRLAEGSARVRLSKQVTREDAKRAIRLLKNCLMQVGFDYETQQMDIDVLTTGISTAKRNKMLIIKEIINELEKKLGKSIPIEELTALASERGIQKDQVEEIIEKMRRSGDIFEPRRGFIQRL